MITHKKFPYRTPTHYQENPSGLLRWCYGYSCISLSSYTWSYGTQLIKWLIREKPTIETSCSLDLSNVNIALLPKEDTLSIHALFAQIYIQSNQKILYGAPCPDRQACLSHSILVTLTSIQNPRFYSNTWNIQCWAVKQASMVFTK